MDKAIKRASVGLRIPADLLARIDELRDHAERTTGIRPTQTSTIILLLSRGVAASASVTA